MKKVLYIHHGKGIGGAPLSLLYLIQKLDRSKYYPTVICLYKTDASKLFIDHGYEVYHDIGVTHFPHSNVSWFKWYQLHRIVIALCDIFNTIFKVAPKYYKKIDPDMIHLNSLSLMGWAIAAKRVNIPVVCHVREPIQDGYIGLRKWLLRIVTNKYVDRFVAICNYDASKLIQSNKVNVVYNFVDFQYFNKDKANAKQLIEFDGNRVLIDFHKKKKVLYLGGLNREKGITTILNAAQYFLNENTLLLIAGKWELGKQSNSKYLFNKIINKGIIREVENILANLKTNGYIDNILCLGVVNDIPTLLKDCAVLVFPSTVPHFARPIIEAGAMGKPVVASNLGGPIELVENGVTGYLVPHDDYKVFAEMINKLLLNEKLAKEMGEAGYKRALQLFNATKNANDTFRLYEELLSYEIKQNL